MHLADFLRDKRQQLDTQIRRQHENGRDWDYIAQSLTTFLMEQCATKAEAFAAACDLIRPLMVEATQSRLQVNLAKSEYIADDERDDLLRKLQQILSGEMLEQHNRILKKQGGKALTYADIALIAAVHRRSIERQGGESPFKRIRILFRILTGQEIDHREIRFALNILEAVGFCRQFEGPTIGQWNSKERRYKKGKCGRWELKTRWLWDHQPSPEVSFPPKC